MSPAVAAQRLGYALAVGAALGLLYGFLRPLRPRLTVLADGVFVLCALWGWVYLMFGLCQGDIRFGLFTAMVLGAWVWEVSIGRLLRPVFQKFWKALGAVFAFFLRPVRLFFAKKQKFSQKTIGIREKMGYNSRE